jgi:ribosomal protein S18 acetylase RimI-like enzyme
MELNIRQASSRDYDGLCTLIDELDRLHRHHMPDRFRKPEGPVREEQFILGLIADENVGLFVAEKEGQLVGFVHAAVRDVASIPILVPRRYAQVVDLVVKNDFQRMGIGRALMDKVHDWALAQGATYVELGVWEFNQSAIAFYRQLGYKTIVRRMGRPLDRST